MRPPVELPIDIWQVVFDQAPLLTRWRLSLVSPSFLSLFGPQLRLLRLCGRVRLRTACIVDAWGKTAVLCTPATTTLLLLDAIHQEKAMKARRVYASFVSNLQPCEPVPGTLCVRVRLSVDETQLAMDDLNCQGVDLEIHVVTRGLCYRCELLWKL